MNHHLEVLFMLSQLNVLFDIQHIICVIWRVEIGLGLVGKENYEMRLFQLGKVLCQFNQRVCANQPQYGKKYLVEKTGKV